MKLKNPDVRYLRELEKVVYDKEWFKTAPGDMELYYMYRKMKTRGNLKYDITIVPPIMLGTEFVKTIGHYHPKENGELYIVLEGRAVYLMQKIDENGRIDDIYAVEAKKGEFVVVPPGYGHITINPGDKELKMADWAADVKSIYEPIIEKGGGGYFYTKQGWIKNNNYESVPDLRVEPPKNSMPKDLSFLG